MRQSQYTLQFCAPAFLGNAEQSGQWRTPPFKAQLRQWWRVAYAASQGFRPDVARMREEEGRLFGHAWLENDRDEHGEKVAARKSAVRIRLLHWDAGSLSKSRWSPLARVKHPEAPDATADLYLGYGPVVQPRGERTPTLKANAAIQAGEENTFAIAYPDKHAPLIEQALALMSRFGTVGGRSRNGWGSYSLHPGSGTSALPAFTPIRPWSDALSLDWAHAIGADTDGPLIWQTRPFANWQTLMRELAIIKIGLRTQRPDFELTPDYSAGDRETRNGINHEVPQARHWLSYPVTHHDVSGWRKNNARLPNSLRFKIRPAPDGQLVGVIFHMPCLPPPAFKPQREAINAVWEQVHAFLDKQSSLTRTRA